MTPPCHCHWHFDLSWGSWGRLAAQEETRKARVAEQVKEREDKEASMTKRVRKPQAELEAIAQKHLEQEKARRERSPHHALPISWSA